MKRFCNILTTKFLAVLFLFLAFGVSEISAQEEPDPTKWSLTVENQTKRLVKDNKFDVVLTAQIEKGWYLYALEKIEGGPIPTRISLVENQPFELGNIVAPSPIETDDAAFGVVTKFYEDSVRFTLPLRVLQNVSGETKLQVKVRYQICNDEMCLPPKSVVVESDL